VLAVAIILGADAVAALLIGTFLFRGRARERVAANGPPDATINAGALTAPSPVASVAVSDPFIAVSAEPVALRRGSVATTSGLLEVIPPAPALEPSPSAPALEPSPSAPALEPSLSARVSVPPMDSVVSHATPTDALEPTAIAAAGPLPGASERPRRVTSRHLVLTVGAGLVLGAVVLAHRR
jgi:hypothetical protein